MLSRFSYGTVLGFIAGEDIKNNDMYILDPQTREIRKPKECDEWLICQLVFVYDYNYETVEPNNTIKKGTECRCWIAHLVL